MQLTVDLSKLPPGVREDVVKHVQHEDKARYALACIEQAKANQLFNTTPRTVHDGIGPVNMVMTPYFRNLLQAKYGERAFSDEDFRKWVLKRFEEFRVKETATKIQVGWREGKNSDLRAGRPQHVVDGRANG